MALGDRSATDAIGAAVVVGGGPAGLIAAEVLAAAGASVTVHEHMPSVGRKLLLAGRGGLNLTHSEPRHALLQRYGAHAERLAPMVGSFGPDELRAWCAELGEPTFVGSSGRVFPASFRATPLLRAWLARLSDVGVTIMTRSRWTGWATGADGRPDVHRPEFVGADGSTSRADADVTILALGGGSWPRVGSDGGWVDVVRRAGIDVRDLRSSNAGVCIHWAPPFVERFAGVPLKNVAVGVDRQWVRGEAMITDGGLEGGPVYAHSAAIRDGLDSAGRCRVAIDLHPDLSEDAVGERLRRRRSKDSVTTALKRTLGLSPVAIALLHEASGAPLPKQPEALAALIKAVPLLVTSIAPLARAISSSGGIAMDEVNDSLMLERLPGVFVAGEMLDWDAPTGGYLLQASFSTGVAAALGAVDRLISSTSSRPSTSSRA